MYLITITIQLGEEGYGMYLLVLMSLPVTVYTKWLYFVWQYDFVNYLMPEEYCYFSDIVNMMCQFKKKEK